MDYSIHIDVISTELPILYFKGFAGQNFCKISISVAEDCFYLSKHADPDEMLPYAAFLLGLHCLQRYTYTCLKYAFTGPPDKSA